MKAIDTNVIVRVVVRDDPVQAALAEAAVATGGVIILPTVLIEAVWVLQSHYGLGRSAIAEALASICAQENALVVSAAAVQSVLTAFAEAGDFADLLHAALAAEAGAGAVITFDRRFAVPPGLGIALELL